MIINVTQNKGNMRILAKALIFGTGLTSASFATYQVAKTPDGQFDVYNIGVARFGRAAVTVIMINYYLIYFPSTPNNIGCHFMVKDVLPQVMVMLE